MKRWYVTIIQSKITYVCSLQSMDAGTSTCILRGDGSEHIIIYFDKSNKFDFHKSKSGEVVLAKMKSLVTGAKIKCKIVFK